MENVTRSLLFAGTLCAAALAANGAEAVRAWPPEPLIEMRVPQEPTAYPADGRHFLVYELRLTSLATAPLLISRLEVLDAATAVPLAGFEGADLDAILQHASNPAVGDRMPEAGDGYRQLAPGESTIVFLTVVLGPDAPVPLNLVHRLHLPAGHIDGARIGTHHTKLPVISAPLSGGPWQALAGAGDNASHHRRQFVVLGGRALMPTRNAIDWKRRENGAFSSGSGEDNTDYHSYGQPVLAVRSGRIVAIRDGFADNHPGHVGAESFALTRENIGGNYVVLELGDGLFAQYMHLKPGSLRVKVNERVKRGQVIAQVGSSGSSFEPHLHFQVGDSVEPIEGEGLPYVIDGFTTITGGVRASHRREMPLKGWLVEFASAKTARH